MTDLPAMPERLDSDGLYEQHAAECARRGLSYCMWWPEAVAARYGCSVRSARMAMRGLPHVELLANEGPRVHPSHIAAFDLRDLTELACRRELGLSPVCYFAEAVGCGAVKIGFSTNIEKRMTDLGRNSGPPIRLRALLDGGPKLEGMLHMKFGKYHRHDEWYALEGEVLEFVERAARRVGGDS